ncbi:hypothetical protein AX16_006599 [Volvariella volvacea WC 439]|nr:hypothetical protein AX16_006599 [Volvariella volvacea WC 439]
MDPSQKPKLSKLACAILVLFSRNHNFLVERMRRDEIFDTGDEYFEVAHSLNCFLFWELVIQDFMRGLLNIPMTGGKIPLNLYPERRISSAGPNFLRHAASWTLYSCPSFSELCETELVGDLQHKTEENLGHILEEGISTPAGKPAIHNTPSSQKAEVEALIRKGRDMKLVTFNEYRRSLGLQPLKDFRQWNEDLWEVASELYKDIDNLELFVGLQCEEQVGDLGDEGEGFNFGFTMTYGLLVDLINTIRSNPDCMHKSEFYALIGIKLDPYWKPVVEGGVLPQLIFLHSGTNRLLRCSPFMHLNKVDMQRLWTHIDHDQPELCRLKSIRWVLENPQNFNTLYSFKGLTNEYGYFLGFDGFHRHNQDQMMSLYALIPDQESIVEQSKRLGNMMRQRLQKCSKSIANSVDIAREVIIPACTEWVLDYILSFPAANGDPLKHFIDFTTIFDTSILSPAISPSPGEQDTASVGKVVNEYREHIQGQLNKVFSNDKTKWHSFMRQIFREVWGGISVEGQSPRSGTVLERIVTANGKIGQFDKVFHRYLKGKHLTDSEILKQRGELETNRVVSNLLFLAVIASVQLVSVCCSIVLFYLDPQRETNLAEVVALCHEKWASTGCAEKAKMMGYCKEAQRIGLPFSLYRKYKPSSAKKSSSTTKDKGDHSSNWNMDLIKAKAPIELWRIKEGCRVRANFGLAHMDEVKFKNPHLVDHKRKVPSVQGLGLHRCPVSPFLDEMLKPIFCLKDLRLKQGPTEDEKNRIEKPTHWHFHYDKRWDSFPPSLTVNYGGLSKEHDIQNNPDESIPPRQHPQWIKVLDTLSIVVLVLIVLRYAVLGRGFSDTVNSAFSPHPHSWTCQRPRVFQRWTLNAILPGPHNEPVPAEYILESEIPHRLSVVDIDARDAQFAISVDNVLQGITSEFEFDKYANCGDDVARCLAHNFSGGVVIVPPGRHTVRVSWAGREFIPGTQTIDWGGEYQRRFSWQLEFCD